MGVATVHPETENLQMRSLHVARLGLEPTYKSQENSAVLVGLTFMGILWGQCPPRLVSLRVKAPIAPMLPPPMPACKKLKQADVTHHYNIALYCLLAARNERNFPSLYTGKVCLCIV